VLILAYSYPPDNRVGALRPFRFAKYLPAYGFSTHVITASPQGADVSENVSYAPDWIEDRSRAPIKIARIVGTKLRWAAYGGGQLAFTWAGSAARAAGEAIEKSPGPWSIFSTSPPLGVHLAAMRLKKRYGNRVSWIADFRDPLAHNPASGAKAAFWNKRIEKVIFRVADHLIANTEAAAERWRTRYPQWEHKISCIYNGFDPGQEIEPKPIPPREYKAIAHVGEIYGERRLGQLLTSLDRLRRAGVESAARTRLELIGALDWRSVPDHGFLERLISQGAVVLRRAPASPREAVRAMCEAEGLVVLDWDTGWQVPAKLYVCIRIGRPILASTAKASPVDQILARSGTPYVCIYPEDPPSDVDAKLTRFLNMPAGPVAPSEWFLREFDVRNQAGTLATILKRLRTEP